MVVRVHLRLVVDDINGVHDFELVEVKLALALVIIPSLHNLRI